MAGTASGSSGSCSSGKTRPLCMPVTDWKSLLNLHHIADAHDIGMRSGQGVKVEIDHLRRKFPPARPHPDPVLVAEAGRVEEGGQIEKIFGEKQGRLR